MRCQIDLTKCKNKEEQIAEIFKRLMEHKLETEARVYSLIFAHLNETKVAPELTYPSICQAFVTMKELPPSEEAFKKAVKNLAKVEIKFMDDKKRYRSVNLIKEV